jgi:hypothetical protein
LFSWWFLVDILEFNRYQKRVSWMLGAFLNFVTWVESIQEKLDLILVTLEEIQSKNIIQEQSIMATFKDLMAAQKKSAAAILDFIALEVGEIKAQLKAGEEAASSAATEKAFSDAIGSLDDFTASVGQAIQGMVPGLVTPAPEAPVDAAPVSVEVPVVAVELPIVITETVTGVEGAVAIDVEVK